jgi:hypothetical protein
MKICIVILSFTLFVHSYNAQTFSVLHDHFGYENPETPLNIEELNGTFQIFKEVYNFEGGLNIRRGVLVLDEFGSFVSEYEHGDFGQNTEPGSLGCGTKINDTIVAYGGSHRIIGSDQASDMQALLIGASGETLDQFTTDHENAYYGRLVLQNEDGYLLMGYSNDFVNEDLGIVLIQLLKFRSKISRVVAGKFGFLHLLSNCRSPLRNRSLRSSFQNRHHLLF